MAAGGARTTPTSGPPLLSLPALRAEFEGVYQGMILMPNLRFASIVIDVEQPQGLTVEGILNSFAFPQLEGLRLSLTISHRSNVLYPMLSQLKSLKVLRLSGTVMISGFAVTCILTELTQLTDFTAEPHSHCIDAEHVFRLLTPTTESVLVPKLHSLRVTQFPYSTHLAAVFLAMLRVRFDGISGVEFTRLRLFSLYIWDSSPDIMPATMVDTLTLKEGDRGVERPGV